MTLEDRCRQMLGQLLMENMALATKLEQAEAKASGRQSDQPTAESVSSVQQ